MLKNRVKKLEERINTGTKVSVAFISFIEPHGQDQGPEMATIPGSNFGYIRRQEQETADAFRLRAHAIKAGGKLTEDMTDDEREHAYDKAHIEIARIRAEGSREQKPYSNQLAPITEIRYQITDVPER